MISILVDEIQLIRTDMLVIAALFLAMPLIAMFLVPKKYLEIRRVPALDAMDDAIGICSERGRPMIFNMGGLTLTTPQYTPAALSTLKYLSKKAGEMGIRIIRYCQDGATNTVVSDYARQGYAESGHLERFVMEDSIYIPGMHACFLHQLGTIERYDPSCYISFSTVASSLSIGILEAMKVRHNGFCICGDSSPAELSVDSIAADYLMVNIETMAAGAWVTQDQKQLSSILGLDFIMLGSVAYLLITALLINIGVKI